MNYENFDGEDLDDIEIYCGSLMGNKASLLQIEDLGLNDYQFCLQIYGGDFPLNYPVTNTHAKSYCHPIQNE
ncbi:hypothetical protein GY31_17080 [Lysinibacillus sphaericus]|uniref:hypothetical protein n=1 Tax=Lysinibacillus TaxID=400634 RepID=UPI00084B1C70|nr:hypothetical protein [Lysinibacillus sphaericus]OEC00547.1 hypothetical protein GY31_17080 [Lysinibacillus sphaericus]